MNRYKNKIKVIEENQPSKEAKNAFGRIAAKSLLKRLGIDECKRLVKEYEKHKSNLNNETNER